MGPAQAALAVAQEVAAAASQQRERAEGRLAAERQRRERLALELAEHAQAIAQVQPRCWRWYLVAARNDNV